MEQQRKKLSKIDLIKSWLAWLFFSHASYNYERLQGMGFAHSMVPIIRKLYETKEDISAALKRHMAFFNTEPQVGAIIHGATAAMEEARANGEDISDEAFNSLKTGLMGPLAGIGDTLTQGTITPILLAFGISLAEGGNITGPVLYLLLMSVAIIGLNYFFYMRGYYFGREAIADLLQGGLFNKIVVGAGVLGCTVMGALVAEFVHLKTSLVLTIGETKVNFQADFFDKIMPKLLPLLLTLLVWWLLKKQKSPMTVLLYIIIIGIVGGLIGVF